MQGSGAGSGGWAPRLVPVVTLFVPLAFLAWQLVPHLTFDSAPVVSEPVAEVVPPGKPAGAPTDNPPAEPEEAPQPAEVVAVAEPAPPAPTPVAPPRSTWSGPSSFSFMVVGVDRREDGEIPRTDTLMIGSVDLERRRLALLSIPRDLFVEIPGYGYDRINAAYVYGEQLGEPDGGIGLLRRTVAENFGVAVDHFGMIDFQCFRTAVDGVGGITIDVPKTLVDPRYPTPNYGFKTVRFESGLQWMDGERALEYARTRNPDNDFGRIRRQQQVVTALRRELLRLRSLPAMPSIVGGCRNLRTDLTPLQYLGLAQALRQWGDGEVVFRTIDERMAVEAVTAGGAEVLMPRWEPIRRLVRDSFSPPRATASSGAGAQ